MKTPRRYFETHLSYNTLLATIDEVSLHDLRKYKQELNRMLEREYYYDEREEIARTLNGDRKYSDYSDYIAKIKKGTYFSKQSDGIKEKIQFIVSFGYLVLKICQRAGRYLPLDLYGDEDSYYDTRKRGRQQKKNQEWVLSQNLGLMKSYMPVPSGDVASLGESFAYVRTADTSRYDLKAAWIKDNFSRWVQPFSTSISGTMLTQLRVLSYLLGKDRCDFDTPQKIRSYLKCFISARQYHSGGHTLHEFVSPIALPEVQDNFLHVIDFDSINMCSLFYEGNTKAFDKAIDAAIKYNSLIIARKKLQQEIRSDDKNLKSHSSSCSSQLPSYLARGKLLYSIVNFDRHYLKTSQTEPKSKALVFYEEASSSFMKK
jgi:hypothetical protein